MPDIDAPISSDEHAKAMPPLSQAAKLADLAEINASLQSQLASAAPSPSPTSLPEAGPAGASAVTGTAPTNNAPTETTPASASAPGTSPAPAVPAAAVSPLASALLVESNLASAKPLVTAQSLISAAEATEQMESLVMSAEDVIAASKIFLKRHPENLQVIQPRIRYTSDRVRYDFITLGGFLVRPEVPNLILALAKKIIDAQKANPHQDALEPNTLEPPPLCPRALRTNRGESA